MYFNVFNWYWIVADSVTEVFSSARSIYVPVADETYQAWVAVGNCPTRIDTEHNLIAVLAVQASGITVPSPDGLIAYASNARWVKEVAGITVNGVLVATDDRSKQMILGARVKANADSAFTTPWVGADGSITVLTAAQIIAISDAVLSHVQSCFQSFATLVPGLIATPPTITTTAQIDAAFK